MFENYTDSELFQLIKNDNTQAIKALFDRYYQLLCRFIFLFSPERETAEELSANVFIRLWQNRKSIVIHSSLKAYLYRSAQNQVISHIRRQKITKYPIDEYFNLRDRMGNDPELILIDNELNSEFIKAFEKLPSRAGLAFKLNRFDGLTYVEISEIMGISVSAVEKNITSALKTLHRELVGWTKVQ